MGYMLPIQMWRIQNRPSNSTSCSDNALRFVGSCGGQIQVGLQVTSLVSNLGLCFEGLFWKRYILKGQIAFLKGIEDFNLEHWVDGS